MLLPHLRDRPLTRIRYPNGVDGALVLREERARRHPGLGTHRRRLPAPGSSKGRETLDYVVADDLPTLVWLANLAALELHTPQWRVGRRHPGPAGRRPRPGRPGRAGASAAWSRCCCATGWPTTASRRYPKTSGKKGMQLCCPIAGTPARRRGLRLRAGGSPRSWSARTRSWSPSQMAKSLRPGKVFIDWSQNNAAKTTVTPYSLRAQPVPHRLDAADLGRGGGGRRRRRPAPSAVQRRRGPGPDRGVRRPDGRPAGRRAGGTRLTS